MKNTTTTINGIKFIYEENQSNPNGNTFAMYKDGKEYGVALVSKSNREIGWNTGIFATDEELEAINTLRARLGLRVR